MKPILVWAATTLLILAHARAEQEALDKSLQNSAIKGGLCVIVGPADEGVLVRLAKERPFLVNWLTADTEKIATVRSQLFAQNLYGCVSIEDWSSRKLPYADNIVSLMLVLDKAVVDESECLRVLRPGGELLLKQGTEYRSITKPRPKGMDEWGQWRHGADRNPVSKDLLVDVPKRIQWLSLQGKEGKDSKEMVSANGRNFYLSGRNLLARDAFNGLPLWTCPIDPKCAAVASGENVFIVSRGELRCIDAATGKPKQSYTGDTPTTVLHILDPRDPEGVLVVADSYAIRALAVKTGKVLWRQPASSPRALSVGEGAVYLVNGDPKGEEPCNIVAMELSDGGKRWETKDLAWARNCYRSCVGNGMIVFETGRFAVPYSVIGDKNERNAVHFVSARDGKVLRDYEYKPAMRHDENARAFIVGDKIAVHRMEKDQKSSSLVLFGDVNKEPDSFPALPPSSHYFYCYPPVATERFFIYGQMSFTDWTSHEHNANSITRGSCGAWSEGMIPANGLMYIFAKSCGCFSMLSGVGALAPAYSKPVQETQDLIKGPAFGARGQNIPAAGDWPVQRGNEYRTGGTTTAVPATLNIKWSVDVPAPLAGQFADEWKEYPFSAGPLTPPVIAGGTVYVAQPHAHRVIALDAASGKQRWEFVANGRIDSSPTIYEDLCLFGTRTGWVYCLRATDGALAWKLCAAPEELRIVHCGQVESPWPVQGSVLVADGTAYFSAGMHPLTDGGLRAFAVDPRTGTVKWKQLLTDMGYDDKGWHARAGLEQDYVDLFVKDGEKIAMSRWSFDPANGKNEFLWHDAYYRVGKDGAYMQRGTWSYGYPMNRPRMHRPLLVCNETSVWGANRVRETKDAPDGGTLKLFRRDFKPGEKFNVIWDEQPNDTASRIGQYFPTNRIAEDVTWSAPYPGWIEAMVLAGDNLFVYAKGKLSVYSAESGKLITESELSRPVWDGIAAANHQLFVATQDGKILCLGAK